MKFALPMGEKTYHTLRTLNFFFSIFLNLFFLIYFLKTGAFLELARLTKLNNYWINLFLYFSLFYFFILLVNMPLRIFIDFFVEKKYGFLRLNFGGWLKEFLKENLISYIIFFILITGFFFILKTFEYNWWIYAFLFFFLFGIIFSKIAPYVILPLFYKTKELEDSELKNRILLLLEDLNTKIKKVYVADFSRKTTKSNAFVCGWGKTQKVILADNLVKEFTPEEILQVLCHEIAHLKNYDVLKNIIFSGSLSFFCFFILKELVNFVLFAFKIPSLHSPQTLPVYFLFFYVFSLIFTPLKNTYSRFIEKRADIFALEVLKDKENFISLMGKLAEKNLAEKNPPLWKEILLFDHPPISKRIKLAQQIKV